MSLPRLALGTAQLGFAYGTAIRREKPPRPRAVALVRAALERGVRCIDTAPAYGDAEAIVGEALAAAGTSGVHLCSKLPALPAGLDAEATARHVEAAVDASRRALRVDRIDTYLLHAAGDLRAGAPLLDALQRCREAGRVECLGVSVYDPAELDAALVHGGLGAVQFPFHAFDARMVRAGTVERARARGWTCFARSALLQGLFALAPEELPPWLSEAGSWLAAFRDLAREHGIAPLPAALGYAAAGCGAHWLVLGLDAPAQLDQALTSQVSELPAAFLSAVDARFAAVPRAVADPRSWEVRAA